jgi:ADP-dependent NAD(P)H-hydrate dehydratase / NAD(P)H-hydrate epimerase
VKILSTSQMREADAFTIMNEPVSSIDLMERAAAACVNWILSRHAVTTVFHIFCGHGNNGGDGLAIARLLIKSGFKPKVYLPSRDLKPDTKENFERLLKSKKISISTINTASDFPVIEQGDWIVDALFGTGLNRKPEGIDAELVKWINRSGHKVVSIDIPSGMFGEDNSENDPASVVKADVTLTFQTPKLAFLLADMGMKAGEIKILDIGLHRKFFDTVKTPDYFVTHNEIAGALIPREKFSHKGSFGHALLIGGTKGKAGAIQLAAKACLRSGAGLTTAYVPACVLDAVQTSIPEAMAIADPGNEFITTAPALGKYNAIGIGPGLGTDPDSAKALKLIIQNTGCPLVIDADALNIISENSTWLSFLPANSILTPHPLEFDRLFGKHKTSWERYETLKRVSVKYRVFIVLKGAYTATATPMGEVFFNSSGNPALAKGGSGDVLTGIITGLMARGLSPFYAAITGVYIHGLSADLLTKRMAEDSIIASDIIGGLSDAFLGIRG